MRGFTQSDDLVLQLREAPEADFDREIALAIMTPKAGLLRPSSSKLARFSKAARVSILRTTPSSAFPNFVSSLCNARLSSTERTKDRLRVGARALADPRPKAPEP